MDRLAADYAECDALLKRDDRDRWLAGLFLPSHLRPHVNALYAFSLEIARVRQIVSEPGLGEIRFQWWREVLAGQGEGHPVAAALADTIARFALPSARLVALIDARLFDLYDEPMESVAALEAYAKATAGTLLALAAAILGGEADAAAGHGGIAYAITGLLRALPWHIAAGQVYVPRDILAAHGLKPEDLRRDGKSPALLAALADMRALARRQLSACAALDKGEGAPAFLPVALCEPYLKHMERPGYDPAASRIALPDWQKLWFLWRAARKIG